MTLYSLQYNTYNNIIHFLHPKVIRNIQRGVWFPAHCLVTHFLGHDIAPDVQQGAWFPENCFVTHPPRFKAVRDIRQ